jgi:hypothetical protein
MVVRDSVLPPALVRVYCCVARFIVHALALHMTRRAP